MLPALARARARAQRIACVTNQKQVGLAFLIFANDRNGGFPPVVEIAEGGSKTRLETWQHFMVLSNELTNPRILRCPSDGSRQSAGDFSDGPQGLGSLKDSAVSYAVGTGAEFGQPSHHIASDRNVLGRDGQGCGPAAIYGFITQLKPGDNPRWENSIHVNAGNVILADGSVQELTQSGLVNQLASTGGNPNCTLKPQ